MQFSSNINFQIYVPLTVQLCNRENVYRIACDELRYGEKVGKDV